MDREFSIDFYIKIWSTKYIGAERGREMAKKVLIVDDEAIIRELVRDFFEYKEKKPPEIREAVDGLHGWYMILTGDFVPDLIVTGLKMPGLNGFELVKRIRTELQLETPIIIYSADDRPEVRAEARQWKCVFIPKNGRIGELRKAVSNEKGRIISIYA